MYTRAPGGRPFRLPSIFLGPVVHNLAAPLARYLHEADIRSAGAARAGMMALPHFAEPALGQPIRRSQTRDRFLQRHVAECFDVIISGNKLKEAIQVASDGRRQRDRRVRRQQLR